MNSSSKFKKITWADGYYGVDIDPYDYSAAGFQILLNAVAKVYPFGKPLVIQGLDTYAADMVIKGEKVMFLMDNYTCSFACASESLRDELLAALAFAV